MNIYNYLKLKLLYFPTAAQEKGNGKEITISPLPLSILSSLL